MALVLVVLPSRLIDVIKKRKKFRIGKDTAHHHAFELDDTCGLFATLNVIFHS